MPLCEFVCRMCVCVYIRRILALAHEDSALFSAFCAKHIKYVLAKNQMIFHDDFVGCVYYWRSLATLFLLLLNGTAFFSLLFCSEMCLNAGAGNGFGEKFEFWLEVKIKIRENCIIFWRTYVHTICAYRVCSVRFVCIDRMKIRRNWNLIGAQTIISSFMCMCMV